MTDIPRRIVAVGLIVDSEGRLLLQHRDDKPGIPAAGLWGLFGGHVERGESPAEAFLREMDEELTWRPRQLEHYSTREVDSDGWHATSHVFAAHLDVPFESLTQREGQGMALFDPAALPDDNLTPGIAPLIREFAGSRTYDRVRRSWAARSTAGLLIDREGRFLLQHRDDRPDIANPGRWGTFGGEIEPYETPHDGFLRELREELGWAPASFELYRAYPYADGAQLIYFFAALVDVPLDRLVLGEGQGMAFFAPDELPEQIVPDLRPVVERFAATEAYRALIR